MQKVNLKRNIRNILVIVLSVLAIAALSLFVVGRPVNAEGNNAGAGDGVITDATTINLDVNGESGIDATDALDTTAERLTTNNTRHLRVRYISAKAITALKNAGENYEAFIAESIINSSKCFDVGVDSNGRLIVTAKEITSGAYFSVECGTNTSGVTVVPIRVYFRVVVDDTFVHLGDKTTGGATIINDDVKNLYVGYKVNSNGNEIDNANQEASSYNAIDRRHASILNVYNYSDLTVDLGEYLRNRALYCISTSATAATDNYSTRITTGGRSWVLNSVSNFRITSAGFVGTGLGSVLKETVFSESKSLGASATNLLKISPVLSGRVEISDEAIKDYGDTFWSAPHYLQIKLTQIVGSSSEMTIFIPVTFVPANPELKTISSSKLRLNVTSQYTLNIATGEYTDKDGNSAPDAYDFSSILIQPKDLLEYSHPSSGYHELTFLHSGTTINDESELRQNGCYVLRTEADDASDERHPTMYKITGYKNNAANNSFTVKFTIEYGLESNVQTKVVEITVETYGGYVVEFAPINGKKSVSYNVLNAAVFAEMRERGYLLTSATSNNIEQLSVHLENNVLTLAPNVDRIDGQTTADISLTFTNNSNQTITFDSEVININVNAGSLFARFEDWQAWLIIAACILAGIIIIMIIVWLFIRAISKRREEEAATQAPVSSYIVKLNTTIAATQAQQRAAQTQALSQASAQMLLGAGPASTAAPLPDTLQLASGVASEPASSMPGSGQMSEPMASVPPGDENLEELIAKYITDDELLERIFIEKYEPKGMIRRTFFKSKDLQTRELEKEKKRIIERYRTPMPMDEAIMSESEIAKGAQSSTPAAVSTPEEAPEQELFLLDFDPDSPLYVEQEKPQDEFADEKIDIDISPEEARVKELEHRNFVLEQELAELKRRLDNVQAQLDKKTALEDELREKINKAETDDAQYAKDIEELEFSLASAKNKDKDRITRDIGIKEEKKERNLGELEKLRAELDSLLGNGERLNIICNNLTTTQSEKVPEKEQVEVDLEKARAEYEAYLERLRMVQARQELEAKIVEFTPMLQEVNNSDYELRKIDGDTEKLDKERESLKTAVASAKSRILGATDFGVISDLNLEISDANTRLSDIEKEVTNITKRRSTLNIDFNAQRRKANEFVEKNEIPLEEVIKAEDLVIGNIELDIIKAAREKDKEDAEKAVAAAQAVYDDLAASSDDMTIIAMDVASGIKDIEEEIEAAKAELDAVNAQMADASEDDQLILMVTQGEKADKIEELKAKLEQANIEGTKRKMEAQAEYDAKLDEARVALDAVNAEFDKACAAYDELVNNTNVLDLIISGSGVISQDQKKIEAENLKKQLARSKSEAEQARLAAEQAQMEAEQARLEAERKAEEARLEAERSAQEAIDRAEQARLDAEEKARNDVEAAERARQEAEEALALEAEEAKRKAQEEAEEAQRIAQEESEEAHRKALEEAEEAKRKAQEEAEEAQRRAIEEAEEAKRKAQEEIEEMRRKAEEENEAKRLEEENKRKEEEARLKAESERSDAIAKKVAMRKDQIIAVRGEIKDLKGTEDAKNLRERLYNMQLTYDEDERGSTELMDFYNKTMDDIEQAGEIARLKAENAKKPKRIVRKVTERVNRRPKRKARPGAKGGKAGARPRPGARPSSARPRSGARPSGARPRPGARPSGTRPSGTRPPRPR